MAEINCYSGFEAGEHYYDRRYASWPLPGIDYFFVGCGFYLLVGLAINKFLTRTNATYRGLPYERKIYVLKNLSKSIGLMAITYFGIVEMSQEVWNNHMIYKIGFFYCSIDVLGLLMVPNLPLNSKIHHIVTFILASLVSRTDFTQPNIMDAVLMFTLLSAMAFTVNMYLGAKHVYSSAVSQVLLNIAIINYAIVIGINVIHQYKMLVMYAAMEVTYLAYFILCHMVLYDDIKLMQYLSHHRKKIYGAAF